MINKIDRKNRKSLHIKSLAIIPAYRTSHYNALTNQGTNLAKISDSAIEGYYSLLLNHEDSENANIKYDCFALRLARFLIGLISKNTFTFNKSGYFEDEFYKISINIISAENFYYDYEEEEILIIHLKQLIHLLKKSGILINENGNAVIAAENYSDAALFSELFNTFWNKTKWEDLFPSDPDAARELRRDRNLIKDCILKNSEKFRIDIVVNQFFELTGFAAENDIFFISFIDFYLFSWLKNFGILNYLKKSRNQPVYIELTNNGRKILTLAG